MKEPDEPEIIEGLEYHHGTEMVSICCGAIPLGEIDDVDGNAPTGICSRCRDWTTFEKDTSDEIK